MKNRNKQFCSSIPLYKKNNMCSYYNDLDFSFVLTDCIHLRYDNLTDFFGCGYLSFLPQTATDQRPDDEQYTLPGVHSIHMCGGGTRVSHQIQHMSQKHTDVSLQPDCPHCLTKLDVSLQIFFKILE